MPEILGQITKNWKAKIISLLVGIAVFAYVQELKMETMNISVPVVYEGRPSQMQWSEEPPRFIKITIRGRKEDLKFPTGNLTATVSLAGARKGPRRYPIEFDRAQIPEKIKIISIPKYFMITFEPNSIKSVFIKPVFEGEVAQGFIHGRGSVKPQKVEIRGPASVLNNIRQIYTEPISLTDAKTDIKRLVNLISPDKQVNLSREDAEVEIAVYKVNTTNEKIIENIQIEVLNLDPALEVFLSDKTIKIHLRGNQAELEEITPEAFVASINLEGTKYNPRTRNILPFDTESGIPIEIKSKIKGKSINILDITPDNLTVRFRIKPEFINPENKPDTNENPGDPREKTEGTNIPK